MTEALRAENIQGNITPGFGAAHQAFVFLRFSDGPAARRWLEELRVDITPASRVTGYRLTHDVWANVAFSWVGLTALGAPARDEFPTDFMEGLVRRAVMLGDRDPTRWEIGGTEATEPHALLVLAANDADALDAELEWQERRWTRHWMREEDVTVYRGTRLGGPSGAKEHFGYRDGISQPILEGSEGSRPNSAAGEFILGYPDAGGETGFVGPSWAHDGSYAVFRRLRQHVGRFRQALQREAPRISLTPAQLGAKLVGRWPSGDKPGELELETTDPRSRDDRRTLITKGDFLNDPEGERFPLCAHVRRANPRDVASAEPRRHRLIRRGIPYGPPLPEGLADDDGMDRGLLFLAFQASIERQFEHVQRQWLDRGDFPRPGTGPDALIGRSPGARTVSLRHEGGEVWLRLDEFVTVTGGGYFFAPSIDALGVLAGQTSRVVSPSDTPRS